MAIYTSYFDNYNNIPSSWEKVAISLTVPEWFNGQWDRDLAPPEHAFRRYKSGGLFEEFIREYAGKLNCLDMSDKLKRWRNRNVVLMCWEHKPNACHRIILSRYLKWKYNIEVKEI